MRPKLGGAFNLHRYSLDKKLDFFVMFSSATTLLGNPGQTNYVAANMGLETLAARRRAMGLPGIAVGWGAIGDTGMLTRDSRAMDSLSRVTGITPLKASQALEALEDLKDTCSPAPALLIADWKRLSRMPLGRMPRFTALRVDADDSEDTSLSDIVKNLPQDKAMARITEIITSIIARIMGVPAASVKTGAPLSGMGMDSLMAVEMMVAIEDRLEGKSIIGGITASSSIRDVATRIYALLSSGDEANDVRNALENKHGITITDSLAASIKKEVGI
jgi:acyl carrier protein